MKIFALGNSMYGDDGIGSAVLDTIRSRRLFPEASSHDLGTDALDLIEKFDADSLNIVVDAVKMGSEPGAVLKFTPEQVKMVMKWDQLSLHSFGLAETFALAKKVDKLPGKTVIIGVEPETIEAGADLSDAVRQAIPAVIELIQSEVKDHE